MLAIRLRTAIAGPLAAVVLALPAAALGAFPQDPPNDPQYDRAEENPIEFCLDDEQWELFDFMPICAPAARDPEGASGMSVNRAWRDFTAGNKETVIAYVEAGVNWRDEDAKELVDKVYLNAGELPEPTTADGDPALSASDYGDTPDTNDNELVDPEDIIVRFSDRKDDDGNGYTDDISGWDFYNDQNDPATVDSAYAHANNQMQQASAATDNAFRQASVCPKCRLLPIKAGAEALDRTDELAQAWLFAVDSGASVIVSVTADLGYSSFMRQTTEYVAHKGVVAVEASNDFNSTDHQGGMWWPHVLPGNGVVADTTGGGPLARGATTYRERSNFTSWGAHNVFSAPSNGGTTSQATPTVGGAVALVMAYGREAAQQGKISRPLSGFEAVQVMRATASDINDPSLAWPNGPGFDLQFGYGRPNLHSAMTAVSKGDVPPVATFESPGWFELHDPTRESVVPVDGHLSARTQRYGWRLEVGVGAEPTDAEFTTVASGSESRPREGRLGRIDLSKIPKSFWAREFALSERKELETTERYTVTLRLRVTDAAGRMGEDRRAIYVHHDERAVKGFPKRIGPGGESQAALADLTGSGRLDVVFGDTDGRVHAIDPRSGRERPGFPVRTNPTRVEKAHAGVRPGHEPVLGNVAVGDLDGRGRLSIVATSSTGTVYVWSAEGRRRAGWPRPLDRGVSAPAIPRPDRPYTRLPARGALAAPVLADLNADRRLEIVQAAWDGHLHAFRGNGRELPGWPVKVSSPEISPPPGYFRVNDQKLQGTPAIADLDGDGRPEVVQRSQYTDINDPGLATLPRGYLHAYGADGKMVDGWPVAMQGLAEDYGTAQEFITEGSNSPAAADVDGDGDDEVASNPVLSPSYLFDGDGSQIASYGSLSEAITSGTFGRSNPEAVLDGAPLPTDVPVGFTTSGAFGRFAGGLSFLQPGSGAGSIGSSLFLPGSGLPINNFERAFDARTGDERPGFPAELQGLDFLGAPLVVDVTGDGEAEVVDGGDSNALHGFAAGGEQAAGFPHFTSGWIIFAPAAGDLDSDGRTELVALTREGYLMAWRTEGRTAANGEWWRWHHDERSTGRYGTDARPPGVVRGLRRAPGGRAVSFLAPGDDWYSGRAKRYLISGVDDGGAARAAGPPSPQTAGARETIAVPRGTAVVTVQAEDDAGNLGRPVSVRLRAAGRPRTSPREGPRSKPRSRARRGPRFTG